MIRAAWVDWRSYTIPYSSIIGVAILGLLVRYHMGSSLGRVLIIALAMGVLVWLVARLLGVMHGKTMLGYGDMQLMVASFIWLDLPQLPMFLIIAGICGLILALFTRGYFPFAPGIAIAWFLGVYL